MTRDEILTLARECHINIPSEVYADEVSFKQLKRFAELVRNQALGDAAKVCERGVETIWEYHSGEVKATGRNVCTNLASSIRSLKEATNE